MLGAVLAATVLFAQATPAASPSPPASGAAAAQAVSPVTVTGEKPTANAVTANKPDELVCHSEPVLGTLFPKKICARRDEIAERKRIDQAEVRKAQALRPFATN
jgi:3-oxoacyl-ACP reductase-like protein